MQIVAADRGEGVLAVLNLDLLAAGQGAEAVAVGHDHGAAHLDELRELGIVDLGAGEHHAGAEGELRLGLALFELGERLLQIGEDQIVRADLAHELNHVELIAGDGRIVELAQIADLGDDAAELVEPLDRGAERLVGGVDAEDVLHRAHDVLLQLHLVVIEVRLVALHRGIDDGDEEVVVLHGLEQVEVLLHALHGGAVLGAEQSGEVVVAALNGALQNGADVRAGAAGHVIGGHVRRGTSGRAQTGGEAAVQIHQHFGNIVAVVTQAVLSFVASLLHELIVGVLQQVFEEDQVFQVFHVVPSFRILKFPFSLKFCPISSLIHSIKYHYKINTSSTLCQQKTGFSGAQIREAIRLFADV